MGKDYIPPKDADFLQWAQSYSSKITANPTSYTLTAGIATILAGYVSDFADKLAAAMDPETRGGSTIHAKDISRQILQDYCRDTAMQISGAMSVTDQQKFDLGLTVKQPPSPIGPENEPPTAEVVERIGTIVRYRVHDGSGSRRGKPANVTCAQIYTYIGATPPVKLSDWEFQGQASRTLVDIEYPVATAPGTVVWFTAQWATARGLTSPGCAPLSAIIAGGAMEQAA